MGELSTEGGGVASLDRASKAKIPLATFERASLARLKQAF
jgi:hypothetical protein